MKAVQYSIRADPCSYRGAGSLSSGGCLERCCHSGNSRCKLGVSTMPWNQRASFAASMHRMVQAHPGQATRFLCRQALTLIPAMCLTLGLKCILVVSIRPQTSTDGFAFCSSRLEGACVPVPSTWGTQMLSSRARQDVRQVGGEMHPSLVRFGVTPRTALLPTAVSSPGESVWAGCVSTPLCRLPFGFFTCVFFFAPAHRMFMALIRKLCRKSHRLRTSFFNRSQHL